MKFLTALLVLTLFTAQAYAEKDRGGGDMCENRIKTIRDDLATWIRNGGPSSLRLPEGLSAREYSNRMERALTRANIECVSRGDKRFPVQVFGRSKVCRFDRSDDSLVCDFQKFNATSEAEQYRLVHHEFAGLAELELPNRADSNYQISNQITSYLRNEIVKRLAVKPLSASADIRKMTVTELHAQGIGLLKSCDRSIFELIRLAFFSSMDGRLTEKTQMKLHQVGTELNDRWKTECEPERYIVPLRIKE